MWQGGAEDAEPAFVDWQAAASTEAAAVHAIVYDAARCGRHSLGRRAVCQRLARFGGLLPQVFDEQARHIGPMPPAIGLAANPRRLAGWR